MISSDKIELFVRLVTRYQPRVYLFILSLLPNRADADEVLQETNLVLWRKFDDFRPGSDFRAWAFQIAYYKVKGFLERQSRDRLRFGQEFLDRVAAAATEQPDSFDARQQALTQCMAKLSQKDRQLIKCRYRAGGSPQATAEESGRSVQAIYKAIARIRSALHDCILRTLATEGHA